MFMKPYQIERIKKQYPEGTRVKLTSMSGENQMPAGLEGDVEFIDDAGQIHVLWMNGSTLALVPGEDSFEIIAEPEQNNSIQMDGM